MTIKDYETFGEFIQKLRKSKHIGISQIIILSGLNGLDYSKMERDLMPAPRDKQKLNKLRIALNLSHESDEWQELIRLADISRENILSSTPTDKQLIGKLPAFIRLSDDVDFEVIIDKVREIHTSEPNSEVAWKK